MSVPFDDCFFAASEVKHFVFFKEHVEKLAIISGDIKQHWADDTSSAADITLKQGQTIIVIVCVRVQVINVLKWSGE